LIFFIMKAIFYGGGCYSDNLDLHREMFRLSDSKKPSITYIPSASDYGAADFPDFVKSVSRVGRCKFVYFPIDLNYSPRLQREALSSDVVFLSGGNTFSFLRDLRRQKLISILRRKAAAGTVMAGLSAGGILLTPNIRTAAFPHWDCDENYVNLTRLEALSLSKFEFFPHYSNSLRYRAELSAHSRTSKYPIIATADGSGLVLDGDRLSMIGRCTQFQRGHVFKA
jgi:dipeptidase E